MAFPRIPTIAAAAAAAAFTGCAAAPSGGPGRGAATTLSPPQQEAVLRAAEAVLAAGSCRQAAATIADAPIRLRDPRHRGALWQPVRVEGCGRRSRLNMLVAPAAAARDGAAAAGVAPLLPGTTVADPLLQREGLRLALMAVQRAAPNCDRVAVHDTRPDAAAGTPPGIGESSRPWAEVWTLSACGRGFAVPVRFAPAAEGGTEVAVDPPPPAAAARPPA